MTRGRFPETFPKKPEPDSLFEDLDEFLWWKKAWEGMPEFVSEDQSPHRSIVIHFRNEEDVKTFAQLLGIDIKPRNRYLYYPPQKRANLKRYRYETE